MRRTDLMDTSPRAALAYAERWKKVSPEEKIQIVLRLIAQTPPEKRALAYRYEARFGRR